MGEWLFPIEGACRCEQVRMRITAPPFITMACHCKGCQRMSSSAYSLSVAVPSEGFAVTQGARKRSCRGRRRRRCTVMTPSRRWRNSPS
jgi:hypothetical protein